MDERKEAAGPSGIEAEAQTRRSARRPGARRAEEQPGEGSDTQHGPKLGAEEEEAESDNSTAAPEAAPEPGGDREWRPQEED